MLRLAPLLRDYISSFALIAAPLTDLTRKGQPTFVEWSEAQEKAFKHLVRSSPEANHI